MKVLLIAAGCLLFASPFACPQAWLLYERVEAGKQSVTASVDASGTVRTRVVDEFAGGHAAVEAELRLSRYRVNYLRRLIETTGLWDCAEGPSPLPAGVDWVRLTIREGNRSREIGRVLSSAPDAASDPADAGRRAFEGCFRWVAEVGRSVVQRRLEIAAPLVESQPDLARAGLRAATRDLGAFPGPFLRDPASEFFVWRVPDGHPCQTLPSAIHVAESKAETGKLPDLLRRYLEAYVAMEAEAREELEWYVEFFAPGEREADYLEPWEVSRTVWSRQPDRWAPWPWDWAQPAEGFRAARLTPPGEPTVGVRFAVPAASQAAVPGAEVAGPWPSGFSPLGSQSLPEDAEVAFAARESHASACVQLELERLAAAEGGHVVRALQVRRGPTHVTDVIVRLPSDGVRRWVAVQSGPRTALARVSMPAAAYRQARESVLRLAASLEPLPLAACAASEPGQRVTVGRLDVDLPAAARLDTAVAGGANPDVRDFQLAGKDGDGGVRLCLRVLPTARLAPDAGTVAWRGVARPARPGERATGSPEPDPRRGGWTAQVWSAGMGMARVRTGRLCFGADRLPVLWTWILDGETQALIAIVCESDDEAGLARARAWIEAVAASAE